MVMLLATTSPVAEAEGDKPSRWADADPVLTAIMIVMVILLILAMVILAAIIITKYNRRRAYEESRRQLVAKIDAATAAANARHA